HLCEGGTEAAAYPTAEGQPDRRIRPVVEEALGLELLRVGVVPAAVLHQVDTGHQGDTRRQVVPAQPEVSSELAAELEDHRPHPQAFLAYRVEPRVIAVRGGLRGPREQLGVAGQPLEGPSQRGGGSVVTG